MANDGKVIISTELDNSGIEKGLDKISGMLGGMKSVLKEIADAVVTAFAFSRIVDFAVESSQAAMTLSDALNGLQSILDGQGRSFSAAQAFIEEYTKDGLIPATNAITAYKNLAMRGYDDSQIQQVMQALKDASAYGRQASFTMGEAVESATEGLKNENSILVDNAGVTKNVAKMWEEYAASIGTTANNLTQQQKIQAEVTGILEESKYQAGDAATVAGTLSGQLQQLSFNFNNLKVAVGNAINPFIQTVLPIINSVIVAFTRLANAVATVVGILFGKATVQTEALAEQNDSVAASASEGAKAEKKLADNTKAAGKAAKRALASFDELNILQFGGGGDAAAKGPDTGTSSSGSTTGIDVEDTVSPKLQAVADKIRELIAPLQQIDFSPAVAAFGRLQEAIAPFGETLFAGLEWAWYNILIPLAEWTIEDVLPAFLGLVSAALSVLNEAILALQPLVTWLWDNFLKPIAEWTGGIIVDVINGITFALTRLSEWISQNQGLVQAMAITAAAFMAVWEITDLIMWIDSMGGVTAALNSLTPAIITNTAAKVASKAEDVALIALYAWDYIKAFGAVIAQLAKSTAAWIGNTAAKVASTAAEWAQIAATTALKAAFAAATVVTQAFGAAVAFLTSPIGLVVVAITALIAIVALLIANWDKVSKVASDVWAGIVEVWGKAYAWLDENLFTPLWNGFKGMANGVIGIINGMIRAVADGINSIIKAVNKLSFTVPDWIPGIGGSKLGFNLKTVSYPQIPYLAKGAVLPANKPFLAMVGDQKHGTNVEAPLATIQEAVAAVMEDMTGGMMAGFEANQAVLQAILEAIYDIDTSDERYAKAVDAYNRKMAVVRGG